MVKPPYKKTRTSKSTYRRPYTRTRPPNMTFVPRVLGNPLAQTETKYLTYHTNQAIPFLNGTWNASTIGDGGDQTIFAPEQGTAYNQRVGRKVMVKKISAKVKVTWPAFGAPNILNASAITYRMILFMDKQTNGTQCTGSAIIQDSGDVMTAFQNPINFGRFKMIRDITSTINNINISLSTNIDRSGYTRFFKIVYKPKRPIVVNYNQQNAGTINDVVDNSFHFFIGCDTDLSSLGTPLQWTATFRTTFCDP